MERHDPGVWWGGLETTKPAAQKPARELLSMVGLLVRSVVYDINCAICCATSDGEGEYHISQ